ncbi:MAG: hypothetical protein AB6733_13155 [Clostridiaceae bacterium]
MSIKFSKNGWGTMGYEKDEVIKKIESMNDEFELNMRDCKAKEQELKRDNIELISEINELNDRLSGGNLYNKLSEVLCEAHLNSVTPIYNSEKKISEMLKYKNSVVKKLEEKNEKVNLDIRRLMEMINKSM